MSYPALNYFRKEHLTEVFLSLWSLPVVYIMLKFGQGILQASGWKRKQPASKDESLTKQTMCKGRMKQGGDGKNTGHFNCLYPNTQCIFMLTYSCPFFLTLFPHLLFQTFAQPHLLPHREKQASTGTAQAQPCLLPFSWASFTRSRRAWFSPRAQEHNVA